MGFNSQLLAALFIVCISVHQTFACRCLPTLYCEATMNAFAVAHVKVLATISPKNGTVQSGNIASKLMLVSAFKGGENLSKEFNVTSTSSSAACGVSLQIGEQMVLNIDKNMRISSCAQNIKWPPTDEQLKVLERGGSCCAKDCKRCEVQSVQCVKAPCPPIATCLDEPETKDPKFCTKIKDPVCGTDGVSYANACLLNLASLENPDIKLAYKGECVTKCPAVSCPEIEAFLCGSDGVTYDNKCCFDSAACNSPNLEIAYEGKCRISCQKVFAPVCAMRVRNDHVEKRTFKSKCELKRAQSGMLSWTFAHHGYCNKHS